MRQYTSYWALLLGNPLFEGMEEATVRALVGNENGPRAFGREETLFGPESERGLAFLLSGSALVYKEQADGKRLLMSRLAAPDAFGMASLFCPDEPFPTHVVAETACEALFLSRAWAEEAIARDARLSRNYIVLLSERIHFLNRRIEALGGDDVQGRLLRLIAELSRAQGGGPVTLPYSMSRLADALGAGRASLYRALDALCAQGVLRREGKTIALLEEQPKHEERRNLS